MRLALEGAAVFHRVGGEQNLPARQRYPEGLGDTCSRVHGRRETHIFDVKVYPPLRHRFVEFRRQSVGLGQLGQQRPGIATIVEIMMRRIGLNLDRRGLFHQTRALARRLLRRYRGQQLLQGKIVAGIVLKSAPELRHGDDLVVVHQGLVAPLQRLHHQLLPGELACGQVLHDYAD